MQKLSVTLAFVAAGLSLAAAVVEFIRGGAVRMTPLIGGLFMLALGIGGYLKLKHPEQ